MGRPLRLLLIEDSEDDEALLLRELRRGGFELTFVRVETAAGLTEALEQTWDIVISDHNMPQFSAPAALTLVRQNGRDLPFIIVSGCIGEELAASAIKQGAFDYLIKDRLARLSLAVEQALEQKRLRDENRLADQLLRDSEKRFRAIIEHSSDGIVLLDAEATILYSSPATTRILGYPLAEFIGRNALELMHPDDVPSHQAIVTEFLKKPGGTKTAQFRYRNREGAWRWIEVVASNFLNEPSVQAIVSNYRDVTERKRSEELEVGFRGARRIQQKLFPNGPPPLVDFDIGGASYPVGAAGGDYFDYIPMSDESLGVVIGDVSGHGFGPALLMASTRACLRGLARSHAEVSEILRLANRIVVDDTEGEDFITLIFARIDPRTRSLVYVNAGHPSGFILDSSGSVKARLESTSIPLGILSDAKFPTSAAVTLEPGDLVLFITDGINEATAPDQTMFGTERVLAVVSAHLDQSAQAIVSALYSAVLDFSRDNPPLDDITAVAIKVER